MAGSFHIRFKSYPSRQHSQAAHVDEQLTRLRSSEAGTHSSICQRLGSLQDLHDSLEKMIHLSITNQALSQEQIEKLLDGSLNILDLCNIANDALSQMKEGLMEIQSILRRKCGDLSSEFNKYLSSKKSFNKTFQKVVKILKVCQNKKSLDVLGEAEAITIALFSFMSGSKACAKWSSITKLMNQNKITFQGEANEFTLVDLEFQSEKSLKIEDVQILESCIQDLEDRLESLSKSLIKYRVSILNIF